MIISKDGLVRLKIKSWQIVKFQYMCFKSVRVIRSELSTYRETNSLRIPALNRVIDISITPPGSLWNLNPTISSNSNIYYRQTTGAFFPIAGLDGNPQIENVSKEFKNATFKASISPNFEVEQITEVLPLSGDPCLEDLRVISEGEKEYLVGTLVTSSSPKPWKSTVAIYDVQKHRTISLVSPFGYQIEKNWVPIDVSNGLVRILYSSNPLQVIEMDLNTGVQRNLIPVKQSKSNLSGGSQFVKLNNGEYLRVARKRFAVFNRGRIHLSYLVIHDANLIEIKRSRPFIFQTIGFEICNGLSLNKEGEIVFSWGENDRKMFLATALLEDLLKWIEPEILEKPKYSIRKMHKLLK